MTTEILVLRNGKASATFKAQGDQYRPEWFRLGERPMLRFKDHEFLNVGALGVTAGSLREQTDAALTFGGEVLFAGVRVGWSVRIARPADGGPGFTVSTQLEPLQEPVELLEAMTTFELPYEYDGTEHHMTVMSQQPVYRHEGEREVTGAGFTHPFWYYGRPGRAHLTFPTQSPLMCCRVRNADGTNERGTMLLGNWHVCSFKDLFAQPSRALHDTAADRLFPDSRLATAPGRRGRKFLVGALNWNISLHKDPNVLVEPGHPLRQEVTVDFIDQVPNDRWDRWLAAGWERLVKIHFPADGHVPAWEVAKACGASWVEAAEWLAAQFQKPEGHPGFFYPERGPAVYAPHTRPKWDHGVAEFSGQWTGPLSYVGHVWNDPGFGAAADRLEKLFAGERGSKPDAIWTIGPTPMYASVMRKARLGRVDPGLLQQVGEFVKQRTEFVLNPPAGSRRGDGGILAWDAFANLLGADLFDREGRESAARELLARIARRLDERFESFNCATEGDLVGAGQGRPFGHGMALTANVLAWRRFGEAGYLDVAERCGNIMMALYYAAANVGESPDLDTRGWAIGSNGGRDQLCHQPPWETAYALQQFAQLIEAGRGREGFYDLLWLFAHTGLCMFPKARLLKRLYTPDLKPVYRPIETVASEREYYLTLPYLAYEEPWDQTMLAGYQGVEPLILSLYLGGGLVRAEDDRVLALVPAAATYDSEVNRRFVVHLWNPLATPVATRLYATVAAKRREPWSVAAAAFGNQRVDPGNPWTGSITVPPRTVVRVTLARS